MIYYTNVFIESAKKGRNFFYQQSVLSDSYQWIIYITFTEIFFTSHYKSMSRKRNIALSSQISTTRQVKIGFQGLLVVMPIQKLWKIKPHHLLCVGSVDGHIKRSTPKTKLMLHPFIFSSVSFIMFFLFVLFQQSFSWSMKYDKMLGRYLIWG